MKKASGVFNITILWDKISCYISNCYVKYRRVGEKLNVFRDRQFLYCLALSVFLVCYLAFAGVLIGFQVSLFVEQGHIIDQQEQLMSRYQHRH